MEEQDGSKQREEEFSIIEKSFAAKMKTFREGQDRIIGCVDRKKDANKRIDHIVQVMSGMKPANAAQVLTVQDSISVCRSFQSLNLRRFQKYLT